jgi:hypothetical protein
MSKTKIDILKMELDEKLPHWLSPQARYSHRHDAARKRNREKYLAMRKNEKSLRKAEKS